MKMTTKERKDFFVDGANDFSIIFGKGEVMSFKGAYLQTMTTNIQNNITPIGKIGSRLVDFDVGARTIQVDLSFICETVTTHLFKNVNKKKIRNKKVDDCTIIELLYAIRMKSKKRKVK